jgi:hypothetical protein
MTGQTLEPHDQLHQFNKLITDLLRGKLQRNTFQTWEIEILLDIEGCDLKDANRRETLRRYQRAANRFLDRGGKHLLRLSEYLEKNRVAAHARKVARGEADAEEALVEETA